jgi:hypothetical protein
MMHDERPEEQRFTTWRNPTRHDMHVDIHESHGRKKRYSIAADKEARIPSEYDRAIHDVRDGIIVGGLAPLLERMVPDGALHPSLDPEESARKTAVDEAERAILTKKAADEVLANVKSPKKT